MNLARAGRQAGFGAAREFSDDHWTGDRGGAPRGEQDTVNRAHVFGSEHIRKERRDGREAATIHGEDHEQSRFEDDPLASAGQTGDQQKQDHLRDEKSKVGIAAANIVRKGCPDESPAGVEQADERDHSGGLERSFPEHVLHHRRGLRENADAGRHVDKQNAP